MLRCLFPVLLPFFVLQLFSPQVSIQQISAAEQSSSVKNTAVKDAAILAKVAQIESSLDPANGLPRGTHGVSKGYHSNFDKGTRVHPTRAVMDYAAYLLASPNKEHQEKGNKVFEQILDLQDKNPQSKTFGVWSWYVEEPLDKMASVDYNWADFQGAVIAVLLHDYSERIKPKVLDKAKKSLEYACRSIIKRNVHLGYTNISIMDSTVTAAAGEILGIPEFLDFGKNKIKKNLDFYKQVGGFNEYNSPAYTMVVIHELERMLYLVADKECRDVSAELLGYAWKMVAEHYHTPTGEWAGPHSRNYGDRISASVRNTALFCAGLLPEKDSPEASSLVPLVLMPENLRHYFKDIPQKPIERTDIFDKNRQGFQAIGTTYMDKTACLGSVSFNTFWEQTRNVIGYWKVPDSKQAAVFRLRFLHNGQDFSSATNRNYQRGTKLVSTIGLLKNQGSMHPTFDRPKDGVFNAKSFRIVAQVDGIGAAVKPLNKNRFELSAGNVRFVVNPAAESTFAGQKIIWNTEQKKDFAAVIGICYEGDEKEFPLPSNILGETKIGIGIELLQGNEKASDTPVVFVDSDVETKSDGKFYGTVWKGFNEDKPLLSPIQATNR
jgi:hypothetical protein